MDEGRKQQRRRDAYRVRRAIRGDLGAFEELVTHYQKSATALAYRLLSNRDDALETVQDAFLKAYEQLSQLTHRERFGPWLMRIVSNLALNRRRGRALRQAAPLAVGDDPSVGRSPPVPADDRADDPAELASAGELRTNLAAAIDRLPEMQRDALVLFSIAGLPQREVAEMLGCSVEAVKWHVFTARKTLKEMFKDYL